MEVLEMDRADRHARERERLACGRAPARRAEEGGDVEEGEEGLDGLAD